MVCETCQGRRLIFTKGGRRPCPACAHNMDGRTAWALFRLADAAEQLRQGQCGVYGLRLAYRQAAASGASLEDVVLLLHDDELIALATGANTLL